MEEWRLNPGFGTKKECSFPLNTSSYLEVCPSIEVTDSKIMWTFFREQIMFVSPEWRCPKGQVPLYLHCCIRVRYSELSPNLRFSEVTFFIFFYLRFAIDLIHDTRHFCPRLGIDGIKAMSSDILGGKQKINFARARNHDWLCLFSQKETTS